MTFQDKQADTLNAKPFTLDYLGSTGANKWELIQLHSKRISYSAELEFGVWSLLSENVEHFPRSLILDIFQFYLGFPTNYQNFCSNSISSQRQIEKMTNFLSKFNQL